MLQTIHGRRYSYVFDFELPEEDESTAQDLGILFHGKCEQNEQPVIIRYIADTKLIINKQHQEIIQSIFDGLNQLHSGIVQTYDCITTEDGIFFVREQLIGMDLHQVAFSGDYPHLRNATFLLNVTEKVCEILSVLHKNKIIHRRIQPSTIFLVANEFGKIDVENPTVKLLNFEYAQVNGQNILNFPSIPYALYYSAPELVLQCKPLINETTDLYSLGMTLYESFAREHAFICENEDKNLIVNMQLSYPLKRHHRIDKQIFPFLQKATAKHIFNSPPMRYKPEARMKFLHNAQTQRFQNANDMQKSINQLIDITQQKKENKIYKKVQHFFQRKK